MAKYLVTGATGRLGRPTVEALLKKVPAKDVSVLVRDPAKAASFEVRGVKVVKGDYFDYDALVNAFTGIDKLLLIGAPGLSNRAPQHENIVKAIEAARPGHVVYVSFYHKDGSKIKLSEVTDVEIKSEKDLVNSGVPYTIVRNALYTQMFGIFFGGIFGGHVKEEGVRAFGPEGKTTYADINDLGQANANLLTQSGHENKVYLLNSGETLGLKDMAALWSEVYGKTIPYIHGTKQEFIDALVAKGVPLGRAEYVTSFINHVVEGEISETSDALRTILGRKPTSMMETYKAEIRG
jgi:NAD(P)H dehydrogenase (quinone)